MLEIEPQRELHLTRRAEADGATDGADPPAKGGTGRRRGVRLSGLDRIRLLRLITAQIFGRIGLP
jgi:hypothetical protein